MSLPDPPPWLARWDLAALTAAWRAARPFAHVVLDDVVAPDELTRFAQAISEEPHWPNRGEIYDMMASAEETSHPHLQAFAAQLGSDATRAAVSAISGRPLSRVDLRSYVYLPGSYLLPHTDCREVIGRRVAYSFYVWTEGCRGGELELFDCRVEGDRIAATAPAARITPVANRLVLFEVTPTSLHQVREVEAGARLSLSGWWY